MNNHDFTNSTETKVDCNQQILYQNQFQTNFTIFSSPPLIMQTAIVLMVKRRKQGGTGTSDDQLHQCEGMAGETEQMAQKTVTWAKCREARKGNTKLCDTVVTQMWLTYLYQTLGQQNIMTHLHNATSCSYCCFGIIMVCCIYQCSQNYNTQQNANSFWNQATFGKKSTT